MKRLFSLLSVAVVAGATTLLPAAEPAHAHGAKAPGQAELGATAAFDADGVLWAAHKAAGHIAVSRSDDNGRSWANPVLVTREPEPTDTGGDARPKIATGARGELYLTWTRPLAQPYTGEIRFARSLDGGRTFSAPQVVHKDRQVITHRFDALAVNGAGQIFVAWIDKRDVAAKPAEKGAATGGASVYFAVSDDRGETFRGDFKVAERCCECCRVALAIREDGAATALWRHIFPPNVRDHGMATLFPDGRASAVRRATFDNWRLDACPHHGPALAAGADGALHGVWFTASAERRGVFYGVLEGGAAAPVRQVGAEGAGHADIAVRGSRVALAWVTPQAGRTHLRALRSADGGRTWRERELGSVAGPADHPKLVSRGDGFFVFWNTQEKPLAVMPLE